MIRLILTGNLGREFQWHERNGEEVACAPFVAEQRQRSGRVEKQWFELRAYDAAGEHLVAASGKGRRMTIAGNPKPTTIKREDGTSYPGIAVYIYEFELDDYKKRFNRPQTAQASPSLDDKEFEDGEYETEPSKVVG